MKKLLAAALLSLTVVTTSIVAQPTKAAQPMVLAYYGQVNSNGTTRTNRVNGYTKSNGTYVNSYYRS